MAIKWVIPETGATQAMALRQRAQLSAPDLIVAECANILWKYVRRGEISRPESLTAARLLQAADIEIVSTRPWLEAATRLAIQAEHPAYDCFYLALALERGCRLITADERFVRRISQTGDPSWRAHVVRLAEAESAL